MHIHVMMLTEAFVSFSPEDGHVGAPPRIPNIVSPSLLGAIQLGPSTEK